MKAQKHKETLRECSVRQENNHNLLLVVDVFDRVVLLPDLWTYFLQEAGTQRLPSWIMPQKKIWHRLIMHWYCENANDEFSFVYILGNFNEVLAFIPANLVSWKYKKQRTQVAECRVTLSPHQKYKSITQDAICKDQM